MDGATFELFLARLGHRRRCVINCDPSHFVLQQLHYLDFIDIYKESTCAFRVKDAEFKPARG
jgi:sugar phosphate isomerase/epimerase